jgi:hypothetical protein
MSQDIRTVLHSAFSFVRGTEVNKATAALTLDHLIQEQIKTLKRGETISVLDGQGSTIDHRPSRWDQLDALEHDLDQAVAAIQAAGDDQAKLAALGIFEADQPSKSDDDTSATVDEVPR